MRLALKESKLLLLSISIALVILVYFSLSIQFSMINGDGIRAVRHHFTPRILGSPQANVSTFYEDWQQILEVREDKFYVYSAYLDYYNKQTIVRVIAVTPSKSKKQLFCHFYHKGRKFGVAAAALRSTKCTVTNRKYSAGFILCTLNSLKNASTGPMFVSVLPYANIEGLPWEPSGNFRSNIMGATHFRDSNLVKISRNSYSPEYSATEQHEFGLCVQPTYNYDNAFDFVQWMEYHLMMGVSHFTFYNMSIGPTVSRIMESYGPELVSVLPWSIPLRNNDSVLHINGQVAQANDCVFRYRGLSKYLVMVDFDEYIVPNSTFAKNFTQLLKIIENRGLPKGAQFQFRSAFFPLQCPTFGHKIKEGNNSVDVSVEDLRLYKHIKRMDLFPYTNRSKFITTPKLIIEPGVHSIDESVDGTPEYRINPTIVYLHHYRNLTISWGHNCSMFKTEVDRTGHFYAVELLKRVKEKKILEEWGIIS